MPPMLKYFLPLIICACLVQTQPTTIHIYGDSIAKGYGLADFANPSPINSIWGIGNMILPPDSGYTFRYGAVEPIQDNSIWQAVQTGIIEPGDVVVFENAGPHFDNTEMYRMWLKLVKFGATHKGQATIDVDVWLATTAEFSPGPAYYNSNYDEIIDSGLSINEVIRQEAGPELLDWDAEMNRAVLIMGEYGATPMLPDGVHPNAFGNFVMVMSVLHRLGVEPDLNGVPAEFLTYRSQYPALFGFGLTEAQTVEILDRLSEE